MYDVLIVGAGPAGAVAATVLARAGAKVRLLDRSRFPRAKLCGDTLNPGALADLRRLNLDQAAEQRGLRLEGMRVTGEDGASVDAAYPAQLFGRALSRVDLDAALVDQAVAAGAELSDGVCVRRARVAADRTVCGVEIGAGRSRCILPARVVIAADGRHSTLAFSLGLASHPLRPRRWAIGGYMEGVAGLTGFGEMHIRRGRYIGIAPLPGAIANVCVVKPQALVARALGNPAAVLLAEVHEDRWLRDRFEQARLVTRPVVIGPLAVNLLDVDRLPDGLLLAGDAAGFVDPMTGDGLRFAIRGGELSAHAALRALEHGWDGAQQRLADQRRREFGGKWRFNRSLRALVSSPASVRVASLGARLAPALVRALITRASDCHLVSSAP